MKNLHEIIDSLIELSSTEEAKPLRQQLDVIIEDLVYLELGKKDGRNFKDLSPEEIQDNDYIEILFKNILRDSIAIA